MGQQTHIFAGMNIAERQFGSIAEDSVVLEIGTNNNPSFTARLMKKYPSIVAYTFHPIHSRSGNHIDARSDINNSHIIWVPENAQLLKGIIKSSNAMTILEDTQYVSEGNTQGQIHQRRLEEVFDTIRGRIAIQLTMDKFISLDNGVAQYKPPEHQRLDRDFLGFPHYN